MSCLGATIKEAADAALGANMRLADSIPNHNACCREPGTAAWAGQTIWATLCSLGEYRCRRPEISSCSGCESPQDGNTALIRASENGHMDIVRMLLDRGASMDATDYVSQPACLAAPPPSLHGAAGPRPQRVERGRVKWPAGRVARARRPGVRRVAVRRTRAWLGMCVSAAWKTGAAVGRSQRPRGHRADAGRAWRQGGCR